MIFSRLENGSFGSRHGKHGKDVNDPAHFPLDNLIRPFTMMKLALVSALVASASAFSPAASVQKSSALAASPYENELGVVVPVSVVVVDCYRLLPL